MLHDFGAGAVLEDVLVRKIMSNGVLIDGKELLAGRIVDRILAQESRLRLFVIFLRFKGGINGFFV